MRYSESLQRWFYKLTIFLFTSLLIILPHVSQAAELCVPDPYATIEDAINGSSAGDTIAVSPGRYIIEATLVIPHPLQLIGSGADNTIIEGGEAIAGDKGIDVSNIAGGTVIKGFHFTNCKINFRECGAITVKQNLIENSLGDGIGLNDKWAGGSSTAHIINNTIFNCYRGIVTNDWKQLTMYNNVIYGCDIGFYEFDVRTKTVAYNNFYNCNVLWEISDSGEASLPADNLSVDPLFTRKCDLYGYLSETSPCIDAGHPDATYTDPDGSRNDIGVFPFQSLSCPDPTGVGGLVAFYPFSGTAKDESINHNDGTVYGPVFDSDRFGNPDRACYFDGTDNAIDCGNDASLAITKQLSIAVWIKPAELNGGIVSKRGNGGYELDLKEDKVRFSLNGGVVLEQSIAGLENSWIFIAATVGFTESSDNAALYVNSLPPVTGTFAGPLVASDSSLILGNISVGGGSPFNGKIDDVRIYNNALSAQDIEKIHQAENSDPFEPAHAMPENGGIGIPLNQTLSWVGSDPDGQTLTYDLYFGTSPTPPLVAADMETNVYDPGILDSTTIYYWQVVATDSFGAQTIGPVWSFVTLSGNTPTLLWRKTPEYYPTNNFRLDDGGRLFIAADTDKEGGGPRQVLAYNPADMSILWGPVLRNGCDETSGENGIGPNGNFYQVYDWNGCNKGLIVAYDTFNGDPLWEVISSDSPHPRNIAFNYSLNRFYFGSTSLYSVDIAAQSIEWSKKGGYYIGGRGIAIDLDGNIYYATDNGGGNDSKIISYTSDGTHRWTRDFSDRNFSINGITPSGLLHVVENKEAGGQTLLLDTSDGSSHRIIEGSYTFVADRFGKTFLGNKFIPEVICQDNTGGELWRKVLPGTKKAKINFVTDDGHLVVGCGNAIYTLETSSGDIDWYLQIGSSPVLITGGRMLVYDASGTYTLLETDWAYDNSVWPVAGDGNWKGTHKAGDHFELPTAEDVDLDNDGMPDDYEVIHFSDLTHDGSGDTDNDGLTDIQEFQFNTSPTHSDSDNDGMPDGWEINNGLLPGVKDDGDDADNDRFTNGREYQDHTDPQNAASHLLLPKFTGRVPDTGQTDSYTTTVGEDSDYLINIPAYIKMDENGDYLADTAVSWQMVLDLNTGLIWEIKTNDGSLHDHDNAYTWYDNNPDTNGGYAGTAGDGTDTQDFINAINTERFGGYSNWRLPTVKELSGLVHLDSSGPAIHTTFFPNTTAGNYWTCTQLSYFADRAWYVNFKGGNADFTQKSLQYYIRAVRSSSVPSEPCLVMNGDGTVTDTRTGLMWQQATPIGQTDWESALMYCETLSLADYDDWRLPSKNELQSLTCLETYDPSVDTHFFPGTISNNYWASSTHVTSTDAAWGVNFFAGTIDPYNKIDLCAVRAVRAGQHQSPENLFITIPQQGSIWEAGETMPITWDARSISDTVSIYISYAGGKTDSFDPVVTDTENDGIYAWKVAAPTTSVNCVITIIPNDDPGKATSQGLFSIDKDQTAPQITGLLDNYVPTQEQTWTWGANEPATFRYLIDQNPNWTPDKEFVEVTTASKNNADGIWYLHVQAKDLVGNIGEMVTVSTVLDNTPPIAILSGESTGVTASTEIDIIVGGQDVTHYVYRLDDEPYGNEVSVTMPIERTGLEEGSHVLDVKGKDQAGNWQETATTISWTIKKHQEIKITGLSNDTTPVKEKIWTWDANVPASFRYAIDQSPNWIPTGEFTDIKTASKTDGDGTWYLHVQAKNEFDTISDVVTVYCILDNTPPVVTAIPEESLHNLEEGYIKVTLQADDDLAAIYYTTRSDKDPYEDGDEYRGLIYVGGGVTYLRFIAIDIAGNRSRINEKEYILDWSPPDPPMIDPDNNIEQTEDPTPVFTWSAVADAHQYQFQISEYADFSELFETATIADMQYTLSTPLRDGRWYWRVRAIDEAGNTSEWSMPYDFRYVDTTKVQKVILVAGGGPYEGNSLWQATKETTELAYNTFVFQGFDPENIDYLTDDNQSEHDHHGANIANLQYAILTWAQTADDLLLVMIDHGGTGTFRMNKTEILTAETLKAWLDQIQAHISGRVIMVYDACESGSFIDILKPPAGQQRVVVTSTNIKQPAQFLVDGTVSFSWYFWSQMREGKKFYDAYVLAKNAINKSYLQQHPQIDADGDGYPNQKNDTLVAQTITIGNETMNAGNPPQIAQVSPLQILQPKETSALIYADGITSESPVNRVWAVISPPDLSSASSKDPILTVPTLEMIKNPETDRYEGTYSMFNQPGHYSILIFAENDDQERSLPVETRVTVLNPDSRGDINGDGDVDMIDLIIALHLLAGNFSGNGPNSSGLGIAPDYSLSGADVNNNAVGMEEILYILQYMAGLRTTSD